LRVVAVGIFWDKGVLYVMIDETREGQEGGGEGVAALAVVERSQFKPAMSIESAVERYNSVREFASRALRCAGQLRSRVGEGKTYHRGHRRLRGKSRRLTFYSSVITRALCG
jgi:hypothetical protein